MHSDGSISDSDVSISSGESYSSTSTTRRIRRDSVESVCTRPTDDTYVMVLQNRKGLYDDLKCVFSLKELCDVTFLVGGDKRPVHGVRAIIATRSRLFYQLILSHEKNKRLLKQAQKSKIRKTLSKLSKLTCARPVDESPTKMSQSNGSNLMIPMETFDPETFQRFMNYIHCGSLAVDSNTVIGVMNAAYMFGFPEVQQACWDFAVGCAEREDNLHDLLQSSKLYYDHKMTRSLLRTVSSRVQMRQSHRDRQSQDREIQARDIHVREHKVRNMLHRESRFRISQDRAFQARVPPTEFQIREPQLREPQIRENQVTEPGTMRTCASKFPDLLASHKLSDDLDSLTEEDVLVT